MPKVTIPREPVLTTDPHGEQTLSWVETAEERAANPLAMHNRLFALQDGAGAGRVMLMTGEELDSLAAQWLAFRKLNP